MRWPPHVGSVRASHAQELSRQLQLVEQGPLYVPVHGMPYILPQFPLKYSALFYPLDFSEETTFPKRLSTDWVV